MAIKRKEMFLALVHTNVASLKPITEFNEFIVGRLPQISIHLYILMPDLNSMAPQLEHNIPFIQI